MSLKEIVKSISDIGKAHVDGARRVLPNLKPDREMHDAYKRYVDALEDAVKVADRKLEK